MTGPEFDGVPESPLCVSRDDFDSFVHQCRVRAMELRATGAGPGAAVEPSVLPPWPLERPWWGRHGVTSDVDADGSITRFWSGTLHGGRSLGARVEQIDMVNASEEAPDIGAPGIVVRASPKTAVMLSLEQARELHGALGSALRDLENIEAVRVRD